MKKLAKIPALILILLAAVMCSSVLINSTSVDENSGINDTLQGEATQEAGSPTLELLGDESVSIYRGEEFVEPGFSASDGSGADITDRVTVTDDINNNVSGLYTVKYSISNEAGSDNAERTVKVKNPPGSEVDKSGKGLPVLMYHWFYNAGAGESGADGNWMEISELEEQMAYLAENEYYFPTWEEVNDFIDGVITLPEKSVVLTFDDGHESFFRLAVPVLEKYGVLATSFLITNEVDSEFVAENTSENVIFRSHSHDMHRAGSDGNGRFLTMSYDEASEDLSMTTEILGIAEVFCYPYGHHSDFTEEVLADSGFIMAFTVDYGRVYPNMDKLALPRIRMSADEGISSFISKVT